MIVQDKHVLLPQILDQVLIVCVYIITCFVGATENAGQANAELENNGRHYKGCQFPVLQFPPLQLCPSFSCPVNSA